MFVESDDVFEDIFNRALIRNLNLDGLRFTEEVNCCLQIIRATQSWRLQNELIASHIVDKISQSWLNFRSSSPLPDKSCHACFLSAICSSGTTKIIHSVRRLFKRWFSCNLIHSWPSKQSFKWSSFLSFLIVRDLVNLICIFTIFLYNILIDDLLFNERFLSQSLETFHYNFVIY